jgi:hypothetical protein
MVNDGLLDHAFEEVAAIIWSVVKWIMSWEDHMAGGKREESEK